MPRLCLFVLSSLVVLLSFSPIPALATVEIALGNKPPVLIQEVYLRDGVSYLAVDDVLHALNLQGRWDSVAHVYRFRTPRGTAIISPGSQYLRLGERFVPLSHPPRFIDGRLRIAENIASAQLPSLLDQPVYYRNLAPPVPALAQDEEESPLDRLFAFILRKKAPASGPALRAIAIDPGHGGQDPGSLGIGGIREKDVVLEVARLLERQLKMRLGIPVYLSRNSDYAVTAQQRLETAARADVDALIILHAQASLSPVPRGVTLVVRPHEPLEQGEQAADRGSLRLAHQVGDALEKAGLVVGSIIEAPLLPLGRGDLPTVLVELGYLSNPEDTKLLGDAAGQEKVANALFEGLKSFAEAQKESRK
jgi:N-acetylmuramoyl-L-alanine amidase